VGTYAKNEISRDQLLNLMAGGKELVDLEQEIAKLKDRKHQL
jgi:simple sugar transport system ATP-binding protein